MIGSRDLYRCTSGIMRRIGNDVSDEAIGIKAEAEVDVES